MTGIKPTTMPTLTRIWKLSTATTPITTNVPARSGAVCAFCVKRISTMKYNSRTPSAPTNPCSSENAAKIKSVWGTGRNAPCVCEPFPPHKPSGTYGDHGLLNLVPGSLGIGIRLQEAGKPLFLVGLQNVHPGDEKNSAYADSPPARPTDSPCFHCIPPRKTPMIAMGT